MVVVYLLTNVKNGKLYVGKTKEPLKRRWAQHLQSASGGSPYAIHCAIRKYGKDAFAHRVLSEHDTEERALAAESEWIAKLGALGEGGYNMTEGGRGAIGFRHSAEERANRSARMKAAAANPEWVVQRREAAKAQWADPEIAARNRAAIEAARATPEVRAKMAAATRASHNTPEYLARAAAMRRDVWQRPDFRERTSAAIRAAASDPEHGAKVSAGRKAAETAEGRARQVAAITAAWSDPERRAKRAAAIRASRTPEFCQRMAERNKAVFNTPEMRAKLSETALARAATPEDQARRAAMRARPCAKCGSPRNDLGRCKRCHAERERLRAQAKRAIA